MNCGSVAGRRDGGEGVVVVVVVVVAGSADEALVRVMRLHTGDEKAVVVHIAK